MIQLIQSKKLSFLRQFCELHRLLLQQSGIVALDAPFVLFWFHSAAVI
jgi:hypothetical protein